MRIVATLFLIAAASLAVCACSNGRAGKRVPAVRPDKAFVRVEGTRRTVGAAGDVGYDVRIARVDGEPAGRQALWLDPGAHTIQLAWSRSELVDWGLHHEFDVSTRWARTADGCCTLDVNVAAGRAYALVFDERRPGDCPMCLLEIPPCP